MGQIGFSSCLCVRARVRRRAGGERERQRICLCGSSVYRKCAFMYLCPCVRECAHARVSISPLEREPGRDRLPDVSPAPWNGTKAFISAATS